MTPLPRRSPVARAVLFALASLAGFLLAGPVARAVAGDGSGDGEVLRACYVPGSGVVYRIGADGLGDACKGKNHVEFSWNAQGPPGPQGPAGPQGPPGPGLTAQSCPPGEFVIGIDGSGDLICAGGGGDAPPGIWYLDFDGDGFGDPTVTTEASDPPADYVANGDDCDDSDASIHPGATDEVGDGIDSDCDGFDGTAGTVVDPADDIDHHTCLLTPETWYPDRDGDGFGAPGEEPVLSESPVSGRAENDCDCDDSDPDVHPGATEIVNGIDDNCNGTVY